MRDLRGLIIWLLSKVLKTLLGPFLFVWSVCIAAKEKRLGAYFYEFGRGVDIMANKAYEPVFNKHLRKPEGHKFGKDFTISHDMAINKRFGWNTKTADRVEFLINKFDKDHLNKTLKNYELN